MRLPARIGPPGRAPPEQPEELIERLVALVPRPRANLTGYHGTLALGSASRFRPSWAELTRRVFGVDVLECSRCQGPSQVVATITQPDVMRRILECVGFPARPPPLSPAREADQPELDFSGA